MLEINLLAHREAKRLADVRESIVILLLGLVAVGLGIIFVDGRIESQIAVGQATVRQLEAEIEGYRSQEEQVAAFKKRKAELENKLEVIRGLERARTGPVMMLDQLADETPERLWFTTLSTEDGRILLKGASLDNVVVADFLRALNRSKYFSNVDLIKTDRETPINGIRLVKFEIRADFAPPREKVPAGTGTEAGG
ncbi:MAG: PilN domain-containing protein [Myxococcota bacterium]|jgi:type IV pilus assembly protein PilN|nr:PilN domain-containing protein [Myxococcota bacterium]